MRDAGTRRRLEVEARRLVVEKYDWSAVAQDFEDALARVQRREMTPFVPQEPALTGA
jgi:hypothetical protein